MCQPIIVLMVHIGLKAIITQSYLIYRFIVIIMLLDLCHDFFCAALLTLFFSVIEWHHEKCAMRWFVHYKDLFMFFFLILLYIIGPLQFRRVGNKFKVNVSEYNVYSTNHSILDTYLIKKEKK